jgi:hypothetical protein
MAECRKCGGPIRVPVKLADVRTGSTQLDTDDPATTARPGRTVSASRWTRWSLAGAREYWVGRRMRRAAGGEDPAEPRTVYRKRIKLVPRNAMVTSLGYALMLPSILGILFSAAALFAVAAFDSAATVSRATLIPESMLASAVLIGATSSSLLGLLGHWLTSKTKVACGGTEAVVPPS